MPQFLPASGLLSTGFLPLPVLHRGVFALVNIAECGTYYRADFPLTTSEWRHPCATCY